MAVPSVFVSSTFYDLRYIRENLRHFVLSLGFVPILSEEGAIYFDPVQPVDRAAVAEVGNCQMLVLIVGGRFGSEATDSKKSVTNHEYEEAIAHKIPVFALVEAGTLSDYELYSANASNEDADLTKLRFPHADDIRIFRFIDQIRGNVVNNALAPFRDFGDIERYLRQQWAGMLHNYLTKEAAAQRIDETLGMLTAMNERIELLSSQILQSVGSKEAKLYVQLYDKLLATDAVRDLPFLGVAPTPVDVLRHKTWMSAASVGGRAIKVEEDRDESAIGGDGSITAGRLRWNESGYARLRKELLATLEKNGATRDELEAYQRSLAGSDRHTTHKAEARRRARSADE